MPQFYVPRKNIRGTFFTFPKSESCHLSRVLRKQKDDLIQIFDGEGFVSNAKITDVTDSGVVIGEILSSIEKTDKKISLKIYPAIIKGVRFEWMLEKVTELGVDSIAPVFTKRTVVRLKPDQIHSKMKRWEKIVLSAAKQCGRNELPKVFSPISFQQATRKLNKDETHLILWEGEEKNFLSDFVKFSQPSTPCEASCKGNSQHSSINLFFGPEGGFSTQEVDDAKKAGVIPVRLGEDILRAETAVLAAVSLILCAPLHKH